MYDAQREQLSDAKIRNKGYTQGLTNVEEMLGCIDKVTWKQGYLAKFHDFNGGLLLLEVVKGTTLVRSRNQANKHAGSHKKLTTCRSEVVIVTGDSDKRDESIKRQEKDAHKVAEALRKEFVQETENLFIQAGAAKDSSTNLFSMLGTQ
ncbi:hypothetical protein Tco_0643921 [Tanacetum coccineum]